MLTALLFATTLAQTAGPLALADFVDQDALREARKTSQALVASMDASEILSDPAEQRILLSAMLCEAKQRRADSFPLALPRAPETKREADAEAALARGRALAATKADQDVQAAVLKLGVLGMAPLSCGHREVERVATCLEAAAPTWCEFNPHVAAQVEAVGIISEVQP